MKSDSKEFELIKLLKNSKVTKNTVSTFLLKNEVNLNITDNHGYNCLHYAIKSEKPEIVSLLISPHDEIISKPANVNINTCDITKDVFLSPMMLALDSINDSAVCAKVIKMLYKVKDNINNLLLIYKNINLIYLIKGRCRYYIC